MTASDWWSDRSSAEKAILIGGPVILAAIMVWASVAFLLPAREVLLSQMSAKDATLVSNHLTTQGIDFDLDTDAGQISVRRSDIHRARLAVAESGLPLAGSAGFELFDEADFGMTDFAQRINYQRALEGELTRTIMALGEVTHARLHLVLPEESLFAERTRQPKAALTLRLRPGSALPDTRVRGIQKLIASSVPGLTPDMVAIHDQDGVNLVDGRRGLDGSIVSSRLNAKQAVEDHLRMKAQEVLDRAFGEGRSAATIHVDLDFDHRRITRDEVLPVREGATGAVTAMRSYHGTLATRLGESGAARTPTTEVDYETGRQAETIDVAQGGITRLTVGILVPAGTDVATYDSLADVVGNAVGLDASRGDRISVAEATPAAAKSGRAAAFADSAYDFAAKSDRNRWHGSLSEEWPFLLVCAIALLLLSATIVLVRRDRRGRLSRNERAQVLVAVRKLIDMDAEKAK